jgi:uncharacterized protein (DUF2344 family)
MYANQKNNRKLSIDDYNAFLMLRISSWIDQRRKYIRITKINDKTYTLNQVHNQPEYQIFKQQQEKQVQNNHQQLHSQVILPSTTTITTTTASAYQHQVPNNISRRNNLVGQKMTPWKLSSLLSTQRNQHNTF